MADDDSAGSDESSVTDGAAPPEDDSTEAADAESSGSDTDAADALPEGAERRERSYRGISERLAIRYLENLGGERAGERTVRGDDWRASLDSETVGIGPSITLTEVTVAFEGPAETLDSLIERFSQKAMRAGG